MTAVVKYRPDETASSIEENLRPACLKIACADAASAGGAGLAVKGVGRVFQDGLVYKEQPDLHRLHGDVRKQRPVDRVSPSMKASAGARYSAIDTGMKTSLA